MATRTHFTLFLWLLCLGLLGGVLWFVKPAGVKVPLQQQNQTTLKDGLTSGSPMAAETNLLGATFTGQNALGETWKITADEALGQAAQGSTDAGSGRVQAATLKVVQAAFAPSLQPNIQNWQLKAPLAAYDRTDETLRLSQGVYASGHGFCLSAPTVLAHAQKETLQAASPVKIWGSTGSFKGDIRSQRFSIAPHKSGIKMQLAGGVRMKFHDKKAPPCALF